MSLKSRTAFVCFFPVVPVEMGSAEVCFSFFQSWPSKNKKLYQMSPTNFKKRKKNIFNILLKKNNSINKIICLPKMTVL